MSCPGADTIRLLAEGEPVDPDAAAHVAGCARCARRVDAAREEEAALRAALPATPPRDLLERTLAAVREERGDGARPARARRRAPRSSSSLAPLAAVAAVVAVVVGGALVLARRPATPAPVEQEQEQERERERDREQEQEREREQEPPVGPAPLEPVDDAPAVEEPEPGTEEVEPWPEEVEPGPEEVEPGPDDVVVEAPDARPPATDPPSVPDTDPGATTTRVLARLRQGALGDLRPGDAIPPGAALRAGRDGAEVEAEGAVVVTLAPRATARFDEAPSGLVVVGLERGRAFARTAPGDVDRRRWAIETAEGRVVPLGTALLVQRDGARTRVATIEGLARLSPAGRDDASLDLRPGFEAELARGRALVARPMGDAARALAWLPADRRPAPPAAPELLAVHEFDDGPGRWTKGTPVASGARGSRGCLRGVPGAADYAVSVELEDLAGVLTIEPDLWLEAVVRVDRRARVALQVWDHDRKENLAHLVTVEPGAWTSVAAPLRAFTDPAGAPRGAVVAGGRGTCLTVFAGEEGQALELLVDDVRVWRQR